MGQGRDETGLAKDTRYATIRKPGLIHFLVNGTTFFLTWPSEDISSALVDRNLFQLPFKALTLKLHAEFWVLNLKILRA